MYASIRHYKIYSSTEFYNKVNQLFVPMISKAPGFISYYGIDTEEGNWVAVSIFETQAEAEESNRLAAKFVKEHLAPLVVSGPEITEGTCKVASIKQ